MSSSLSHFSTTIILLVLLKKKCVFYSHELFGSRLAIFIGKPGQAKKTVPKFKQIGLKKTKSFSMQFIERKQSVVVTVSN